MTLSGLGCREGIAFSTLGALQSEEKVHRRHGRRSFRKACKRLHDRGRLLHQGPANTLSARVDCRATSRPVMRTLASCHRISALSSPTAFAPIPCFPEPSGPFARFYATFTSLRSRRTCRVSCAFPPRRSSILVRAAAPRRSLRTPCPPLPLRRSAVRVPLESSRFPRSVAPLVMARKVRSFGAAPRLSSSS